jgi:hypothetical protein
MYWAIGLLSLIASVHAATNLASAPVRGWEPVEVAIAVVGFLMFVFLTALGLSSRGAKTPEAHTPSRRPLLLSFFVPASLIGLAAGGGVAFWQGMSVGWGAGRTTGFATAVIVVSSAALLVILKLARR